MFIRKLTPLLIVGICFLEANCRHDPTIWRAEVPSPDGLWAASVETLQYGGFGTAGIYTMVYLRRALDPKSTKTILTFSCEGPAPHPYVLDDANAGGTIHLSVKWATPKRLEVSYDGHAILYSPVDRVGDVDISVGDLSGQEAKSPDGDWLATASTEPYSGGDVLTNVFLRSGKGTATPQRILGFRSDSATYTRSGALDLRLKWTSPSRLEVTQDRCLRLDFRVARFSGIDIALEDAGRRDLSQEQLGSAPTGP